MNLNIWDYYDLDEEISKSNVAGLLELFKREEKKYNDKCVEYANNLSKLNEEGKNHLQKECEFLKGAKIKISLRIAENLTK